MGWLIGLVPITRSTPLTAKESHGRPLSDQVFDPKGNFLLKDVP